MDFRVLLPRDLWTIGHLNKGILCKNWLPNNIHSAVSSRWRTFERNIMGQRLLPNFSIALLYSFHLSTCEEHRQLSCIGRCLLVADTYVQINQRWRDWKFYLTQAFLCNFPVIELFRHDVKPLWQNDTGKLLFPVEQHKPKSGLQCFVNRVDLHKPDLTSFVDIRPDLSHLSTSNFYSIRHHPVREKARSRNQPWPSVLTCSPPRWLALHLLADHLLLVSPKHLSSIATGWPSSFLSASLIPSPLPWHFLS